jgi:hypothetical protein
MDAEFRGFIRVKVRWRKVAGFFGPVGAALQDRLEVFGGERRETLEGFGDTQGLREVLKDFLFRWKGSLLFSLKEGE